MFTLHIWNLEKPNQEYMALGKGPLAVVVLIFGSESETLSVVSKSLRPHGLYSPWNSPGPIAGRFFTSWATREALLENPQLILCKWFPTELAFPGKDWVIWMDSMGWEMEERRISTGSSYLWDVPDTAAQQLTKPSRLNQALSRVNEWDWLFRFYRNQG